MNPIRGVIEAAFARFDPANPEMSPELERAIETGLDALDRGQIRAIRWEDGAPVAEPWVKKLILLSFRMASNALGEALPGQAKCYDKIALKFAEWTADDFQRAALRVVPGAVVRRGAFVGPGAVLMPSFVNIGAYVGEQTMIDTWATVGSCAQVGARCHISGGAGIGGVLEPIGDAPVVIEDEVFIGARAEVAEGVRVRRGAVIGMGVYLGRSTPIVDRESGSVTTGEIPENAVVVPGGRIDPKRPHISSYAALIVKYADQRTRSKTELNAMVRERPA